MIFVHILKTVRKILNWVYKRGTFSVQNGISKGKGFGLDLGKSLLVYKFVEYHPPLPTSQGAVVGWTLPGKIS